MGSEPRPFLEPICLGRAAMGARFELVLPAIQNPARLRAAGEEALDEIERLERQLSLYRPSSDLSRINRLAAKEPVRIDPRFFRLLERAVILSWVTDGAFDPTMTPLLRAWGFVGGRGEMARPAAIEEARSRCGYRHVLLNPAEYTVSFDRDGVELDLGAIGKGYAVERALQILEEVGVESAFLHGGTSTIGVIGAPPDAQSWTVTISHPGEPNRELARVSLPGGLALSVSALHEKSFVGPGGETFGHILDPRTGWPVRGAPLSAVVSPSATDSDALSTALLVAGEPPVLASQGPGESREAMLIRMREVVWNQVSTLALDQSGRTVTTGAAFKIAIARLSQ